MQVASKIIQRSDDLQKAVKLTLKWRGKGHLLATTLARLNVRAHNLRILELINVRRPPYLLSIQSLRVVCLRCEIEEADALWSAVKGSPCLEVLCFDGTGGEKGPLQPSLRL